MGIQVSKPVNPADLTEYRRQLSRPVTITKFQETIRRTQIGDREPRKPWHLYLGANEVFFDANQHVHSVRSQTKPDGIQSLDLNKSKLFKHIGGLGRTLKDTLFWSFYVARRATITLYVRMDVRHECTLRLTLDKEQNGNTKDIVVQPAQSDDPLHYAIVRRLKGLAPGFHTVRVQVVQNSKPGQFVGPLHYIKLSANRPLSIVRERWRPLATHIVFRASTANKIKVHRLVMCLEQIPSLISFAPVTTPFGYYGPVIDENGQAQGMNFSIWSYGRDQKHKPPPKREWSHLVALGHPDMKFGEFFHEGSGVKPRISKTFLQDWKPPYAVALTFSCEPTPFGEGFHTLYTGHYWIGGEWKLFAAGKEYTVRRKTSLRPTAFIEVAGAAARQRTNHVPRIVSYQGFVAGPKSDPNLTAQAKQLRVRRLSYIADLDEGLEKGFTGNEGLEKGFTGNEGLETVGTKSGGGGGSKEAATLDESKEQVLGLDEMALHSYNSTNPLDEWHKLDQIEEPAGSGYTNKRWTAEDDYLQASCGGLDQNPYLGAATWHTMHPESEWPEYMKHIDETDVPIPYPTILSAKNVSGNGGRFGTLDQVELTVDIPPHEDEQQCKVYSGPTDGLTLGRLWTRFDSFPVHNGTQTVTVPAANFYRVLLERPDGRYWSLQTYHHVESRR